MSTYPQSIDSTVELYDDLIVDRTFAGLVHTRSTIPRKNVKRVFNVVHPFLTLSQAQELREFYRHNRDTSFGFLWKADKNTYKVKFIAVPKITVIVGNNWKATVSLVEV